MLASVNLLAPRVLSEKSTCNPFRTIHFDTNVKESILQSTSTDIDMILRRSDKEKQIHDNVKDKNSFEKYVTESMDATMGFE